MEDIFIQGSLCYLTNRCDEGFDLISSFLISFNNNLNLNFEEQEVFCLISMNIIERRYKSWLNLHHLLIKTNDIKICQLIENYLEIIFNELNFYSKKILFLIEKYLFEISSKKIFYLKIQGDIHFILSQIFKFQQKFNHIQLALQFYNQSLDICYHQLFDDEIFPSIIYNKSLIFILLTEEYDKAKNILKEALNYLDKRNISNKNQYDKLKNLLKYLDNETFHS